MTRSLILLLPLFFLQILSADLDNANHLRGIRYLYMDVDTSMASDISAGEELDLNDIMELQLRRGDIALRQFVVNQPRENIPLIELGIDTITHDATGEFELVLRIRDYVTIDRNGEKTVATIYEMKRLVASTGDEFEANGFDQVGAPRSDGGVCRCLQDAESCGHLESFRCRDSAVY